MPSLRAQMYLSKLRIENLRTIESAEIQLCVPQPLKVGDEKIADDAVLSNVTLLLGTNGVGKTSVLRAIAMAVLAPLLPRGSGYVPRSMVRRVARDGDGFGDGSGDGNGDGFGDGRPPSFKVPAARIVGTLHFSGQDGLEATVESALGMRANPGGFQDRFEDVPEPAWATNLWNEESPAFFMVGYGASRRVDQSRAFQVQEKERALRYLRVAGLFEDSVVLRPLSSWLPTWKNPGRRKQVLKMIEEIIPEISLTKEPVNGEYLFRFGNTELPFDALSDGFRAFIGWVVDLLFHVCRGVPDGKMLFETAGIVLVDEVDLHLHPALQQRVIRRLARALPNIQFVFSSHSPLLVGSLHRENVRVLRSEAERTIIEPASIEVFGLSADQVLTSPYFALQSTREPVFVEKLQSVAKQARDGDAKSAQHFLRMLTLGAEAGDKPPPKVAKKRTAKKKSSVAKKK